MMFGLGSQLQCEDCHFNCHVKCAKYVENNCGGVGTIRLRLKYEENIILQPEEYQPLLKMVHSDDFKLLILLGRVSQDRENAAKVLIKIFEHEKCVMHVLNALISSEIENTADVNTLFRGNSIATKITDVFMKRAGLPYLVKTLEKVINAIISEQTPCELDPTRIDSGDKQQADLKRNLHNFLKYCNTIIGTIFAARAEMPDSFRYIFANIKESVRRRFPSDPDAPYISISGFLFLRFFAPAVLGPKLFKMCNDYTDAKTSRTLTLLAKMLQNIANLVEFGQKESYLLDANPFIREKIPAMKEYLDDVSTWTLNSAAPPQYDTGENADIARECGRLYEQLVKSTEKMVTNMTGSEEPLVMNLLVVTAQLSNQIDEAQRKLELGASVRQNFTVLGGATAIPAEKRPLSYNHPSARPSMSEASKRKTIADPMKILPVLPETITVSQVINIEPATSHVATIETMPVAVSPSPSPSFKEELNPAPVAAKALKSTFVAPQKLNASVKAFSSSPTLLAQTEIVAAAPAIAANSTAPTSTSDFKLPEKFRKSPPSPAQLEVLKKLHLAKQASETLLEGGVAVGKCSACTRTVFDTDGFVKYGDSMVFHEDHFRCASCNQLLPRESSSSVCSNGKMYCEDHAPAKKVPVSLCDRCGLEIEFGTSGFCVKALQGCYHPQCFTCTGKRITSFKIHSI